MGEHDSTTPAARPQPSLDSLDKSIKAIKTLVETQSKETAQIPYVKETADKALASSTAGESRLTVVETRQESFGERIKSVEGVQYPPCKQSNAVKRLEDDAKEQRRDKEEGIKTRQMVYSLKSDVEEVCEEVTTIKRGWRGLAITLVLAAVGIVSTIVGAAWNISGDLSDVRGDISEEQALRTVQYGHISEKLAALPTSKQVPTKEQVQKIHTIVKKNGDEFCEHLTKVQRARLRRDVQLGLLPPTFDCLEPEN